MYLCDIIKSNKFGIDAFALKIIAVVTMMIDHIGYIFFPQYLLLRIVGRISFPIFAFMIVEGFMHTRDVRRYIVRLAAFALLSEIPFDLAFFGNLIWTHQNVLITFILAILAMYVDKKYKRVAGIGAAIALSIVADLIHSDYGMFGVIVVMVFYWNYSYFTGRMLAGVGALTLLVKTYQIFDVLAMIPIALYNGKRGINIKYFFYVFYPGHLLILYLIHMMVG